MYVAFFIFPFPSFKIYLSLPVAGGGGGGDRSSLLLRLSLVAVSGGYSLVAASQCGDFSCGAQALGQAGFSSCNMWA